MAKIAVNLAILFLIIFPLKALEVIYEQYGNQIDLWVVIPYSTFNFPKGADRSEYQISVQITDSRKKPVTTFSSGISIPKKEWLQNTGIPLSYTKELNAGSYNLNIQLKNKALGEKRNFSRHFEIGQNPTEIGMGWLIAKREGIEYIPESATLNNLDELTLKQSFSITLDSLKIRIDKQFLTLTKPQSPISIDLKQYCGNESGQTPALTFYERNIQYRMEPFLFSPWYSYSLRYSLEDQLQQIRYIATQNEWQILRKLPKTKYAEAIEGYWKANDPSPGTVKNETRERFYQRVLKADELFSIHKKMKGWNSDRGRIYIKYGDPDDIYTESYPLGKYPHIIWTYYKQNLQFIFADTKGYGQYTLRNKDEEY